MGLRINLPLQCIYQFFYRYEGDSLRLTGLVATYLRQLQRCVQAGVLISLPPAEKQNKHPPPPEIYRHSNLSPG